jgi:guanylate kinase
MIQAGEFVEWAEVVGHLYGTARKQLRAAEEAGEDILLDIDVQGHRQVREKLARAVSVFILPPSFQELERRLRRRRSDAPEVIERRLKNARREIGHWSEYDFLVVNDKLRSATKALRAVVEAAKVRACVQQERADEISQTFGG